MFLRSINNIHFSFIQTKLWEYLMEWLWNIIQYLFGKILIAHGCIKLISLLSQILVSYLFHSSEAFALRENK